MSKKTHTNPLSRQEIFYMRDKTQDDRYFILTLFAIAKELEKKRYTSPVVSVDLAVGLPPEHYGVLKERFAAYFKREKPVRFSYKGRQIMLSINRVLVFPQAYAAVALDSSSTIGYSRLFLIDIGGIYDRRSPPAKRKTRSAILPLTGMWDHHNEQRNNP